MALEIANLKATIAFAATGSAEATRAAASVERAVKALGTTLEEVGGSSTTLEQRLATQAARLDSAQATFDAAKESAASDKEELARLTKELDDWNKKLSDGKASLAELNKYGPSVEGFGGRAEEIERQIAAMGSAEAQTNAVAAAEANLAREISATAAVQERANAVFSNNALRAYENQVKITTATTLTMRDAQAAAIDEIERLSSAGEDAAGAVGDFNALLAQQAAATVQASEQTLMYAAAVQQLEQQLQTAEGADAQVTATALEHAQAALEASKAYDVEASSAEELTAALKELYEARDQLTAAIAAGEGGIAPGQLDIVQKQIGRYEGLLGGAQGRAGAQGEKAGEQIGLMSQALEYLGMKSGNVGQKLAGLTRSFSGIMSASRGGVQGISMMATSLGRLGPYAVAAAAAIYLVFKAFKNLGEQEAVSHIAPLSEEMIALGEASLMTESQMKPVVQQVRNFVAAMGFSDIDKASEALVGTAEALKNVTPSGTQQEALQNLQRLMQGDAKAADQFNDSILGTASSYAALNEELRRSGYTEAQRAAAIYAEIQKQISSNADEIAAANGRDEDSIAELKFAWDQLVGSITNALAGPLQAIIEWTTALVEGIAASIEKIVDLRTQIRGLAEDGSFLDGLLEGLTTTMVGIASEFKKQLWRVPWEDVNPGEFEDGLKGIEDQAGKTEDALKALGGVDPLSHLESVALAQEKFGQYLNNVKEGQNAISAVKNLGDALIELEKSPDPNNIMAAMTAFQAMFAIVQAGGIQALDAFDNFVKSLGFGPEVEAMVEQMTGLTREALMPFEEHLNSVGVEAGKVQGPVGVASDSFIMAGDTASAATPKIYGIRDALAATAGTYTATLNIVTTGGIPNLSGWGGGTGFSSAAGASWVSGKSTSSDKSQTGSTSQWITQAPVTSSVPKPTDTPRLLFGGQVPNIAKTTVEAATGPATDLSKLFGGSPGGGGGGGGGGGDDKDLAIEEIRKFIQQVNKAVMAGIRGGLVYSTAGNAIPLGGPGEFVSNEGGVNIGTINLRGVWDFADPAAKREIVRQLQEALAQYQKEVS